MKSFWCERAWLPSGITSRVLVRVEKGVIASLSTVDTIPLGAERLHGLVFPGFANAHSHAFHRALRGRTNADGGTFWTWRDRMYAVAERLTPDSYLELATAVYAEMAVAGVTAVGEFHYLHNGGNEMAEALRQAARDAGIRLTLLDACYLAGGIGQPVRGVQERFSDGTGDRWLDRVAELRGDGNTRIGAAIHSVRAVPADQLTTVVEWARGPAPTPSCSRRRRTFISPTVPASRSSARCGRTAVALDLHHHLGLGSGHG